MSSEPVWFARRDGDWIVGHYDPEKLTAGAVCFQMDYRMWIDFGGPLMETGEIKNLPAPEIKD